MRAYFYLLRRASAFGEAFHAVCAYFKPFLVFCSNLHYFFVVTLKTLKIIQKIKKNQEKNDLKTQKIFLKNLKKLFFVLSKKISKRSQKFSQKKIKNLEKKKIPPKKSKKKCKKKINKKSQ